ncbi:MAG TPA: phosphatidylglycerol lysyltransferase domain-containing protein [Jatrophihabitans sp.]|nr:phosphatidylglycerol lysyltransferase domain-containing protein [Jatrophihabitans sp.]
MRTVYLQRAPDLIAGVALLLGLLTIVDAVFVDQRGRVHAITRIIPVPASAAATAVVFVSGMLLLRLSAGLRKRKHRAWQAAVVATAGVLVAHVFRGERRYVEAAIGLVLLVLLLLARSRFTAKPDPRSRWFALRFLLQAFAFSIVYGLAVLYIAPGQVAGDTSFLGRLQEVLYALVGVDGPVVIRSDRLGDALHATLFGLALVTAFLTVVFALRPEEPVAVLSDEDELRLRQLLERHGSRDSLGYFALRRDKSVVWSASGKAAITYRVVLGVALVSGDPIGDPEAWPGAIATYRQLVEEHAWTPAVMGCSELGATVFKREYGLAALQLGDEAVVEVKDFTLEGRPMRGVRQACTRVARAGYDVRTERVGKLAAEDVAELRSAAEAWRGDAVERGFSMALSRLGDPADADCVVVTARHDGRLAGLLHFVPWGADGLSLDLMRRDRAADNGLNEYMIAALLESAPELGVGRVSLNFAVFRDAIERGERIGAGPVLRLWRSVLVFASRWWQIESLYRFNAKFRPCWEPRFISFPSTRDIPRIAVAALEAEAFLTRPRPLKRLLGRG